MMKIQKKDEPLRANFVAFENVSYHLNATPLSVAMLASCAWGENSATRQSKHSKFSVASVCGRSRQSENGSSV